MKGGIAHGKSDKHGILAAERKVRTHDLHATMLHLLGIGHEGLTTRHAGRDCRLTDVSGEAFGPCWPETGPRPRRRSGLPHSRQLSPRTGSPSLSRWRRCWNSSSYCRAAIDAEVVQDRRRQVGRRDRVVGHVAAVAGRRAVDLPAAHAAAGQQRGEGVRPVVAAGLLRVRALRELAELRRAAELADRDDQRRLQQAAVVQVFDERRERPVERRAEQRPSAWRSCPGACPSRCSTPSIFVSSCQLTVTSETPASTSRRASSRLWPTVVRP